MIKGSLTLDLTANPDFSQVESDEPQVTVNKRFEVFFPERRPFFMENSQLFCDTGADLPFAADCGPEVRGAADGEGGPVGDWGVDDG